MDTTFLAFVSFVAIALIVAAILMLFRDMVLRRRALIEQRLGDRGAESALKRLPLESEQDAPSGIRDRIDSWYGKLIAGTGLDVSPEAAFLLAFAVGLIIASGLLLWSDNLIAAVVGVLIGMTLVTIYYYYLRSRRQRAIQEQLPDVMELMARAVRAGESIDQAIALVGETASQPLGREFDRCARHLEMGLSMDSTMRALTRRTPMAEIRILAATLMVQRQTGGNLPVTLERLAKVVQDRLSYHRQFRASTAAGRFSTIVIASVGPLVLAYMWIFQREYIETFLATPRGQILLAVAVFLYVVGLAWIYRLLKSDY